MPKKAKKSYSAHLKFQAVLEALTSDNEDAEPWGLEYKR